MNQAGLLVKLSFAAFAFLMVSPFVASSQSIVISGLVKDSVTQEALSGATVYDKTSLTATQVDSSGYYSLSVHEGDELVYRYLGYRPVTYKVPGGSTNIFHIVEMASKREQLNAVTILGLTPYQADSADRIKDFKHYLDKPRYGLLSDMSAGTGLGLSLNLDYFTKESRRKRKFHKMFYQFEQDAFIDSRYTPQLVQKLTGLQGDSLTQFLYLFKPSYEFARYATDLEFWSWITMKYRLWIKQE